jgi:hypothetical protein
MDALLPQEQTAILRFPAPVPCPGISAVALFVFEARPAALARRGPARSETPDVRAASSILRVPGRRPGLAAPLPLFQTHCDRVLRLAPRFPLLGGARRATTFPASSKPAAAIFPPNPVSRASRAPRLLGSRASDAPPAGSAQPNPVSSARVFSPLAAFFAAPQKFLVFFLVARILGLSAYLSALCVSALSFLPVLSLRPESFLESFTSLLRYFATSLPPCFSLFSLPAPIPPLAPLCRQPRIPRLRHRRTERVQHAGILPLAGDAIQPRTHPLRVLLCQLRHAADAQHLEIAQHRRSNRNQILERTPPRGTPAHPATVL